MKYSIRILSSVRSTVALWICSIAVNADTHNISCGAQPVELTASSGVIKSPGYYHGSYPNNAFCQWRIVASTGNVRYWLLC